MRREKIIFAVALTLLMIIEGVAALTVSGTVYYNVNGTSMPGEGAVVNLTNGTSDFVGQDTADAAGAYSISTSQTVPPPMLLTAYVPGKAVAPESKPTNPTDNTQTIDIQFSFSCLDSDGDSYYASWCGGTDCNDSDATIFAELTGYADKDSDGFTLAVGETFCTGGSLPANYSASATATDCNDNNAGINPGASETHCNNIDEDCSGADYCLVDDDDDDDGGSHSSGGGVLYTPDEECSENWICDDWAPDECPQSEEQTRTCEDINACGTDEKKPDETRTCDYIAPEPETETETGDDNAGENSGMGDVTGAVVGTDQKSSLWPLFGVGLIIAGLIGIAGLVRYIRKK